MSEATDDAAKGPYGDAEPPTQPDAGGPALRGHWTGPRTEMRSRLSKLAPPLADLYAGAVELIEGLVPRVPGWRRFVAHAVREILNGLPTYLRPGDSRGRCEYKQLVSELDAACEEVHWKAGEPCSATMASSLQTLLEEHRAATGRRRDAAERMLHGLGAGLPVSPEVVSEMARQWLDVGDRFQSDVHDRRGKPDRTHDDDFEGAFREFESLLGAVTRPFLSLAGEIDELLERA